MDEIAQVYFNLLQQQQFVRDELDYSVFEKHLPTLKTLSNIGNSGISVFDLSKIEHIYYSPNFCPFLGYDLEEITQKGQDYLTAKIHPDDHFTLTKNGISLLKLFYQFSSDEKTNFKFITEYRIQDSNGQYVRVIEQHQCLELDKYGNLWLAVSMVDISPNQSDFEGVTGKLLNFRTGEIVTFLEETNPPGIELTKREKEILQLVKNGLLSKEISDQLSISIHTVNTHRQRLLEKLGANNSIEAVIFASKLGFLS